MPSKQLSNYFTTNNVINDIKEAQTRGEHQDLLVAYAEVTEQLKDMSNEMEKLEKENGRKDAEISNLITTMQVMRDMSEKELESAVGKVKEKASEQVRLIEEEAGNRLRGIEIDADKRLRYIHNVEVPLSTATSLYQWTSEWRHGLHGWSSGWLGAYRFNQFQYYVWGGLVETGLCGGRWNLYSA